jgi:hypothetical protein
MLIGAMNPCPCGYFSDPVRDCTCSHVKARCYEKRVSRRIPERIGVYGQISRVMYPNRSLERSGKPSLGSQHHEHGCNETKHQAHISSLRFAVGARCSVSLHYATCSRASRKASSALCRLAILAPEPSAWAM